MATSQQSHMVQVYDVVLDAALRAQKCGPCQLQVQGDWEWLLSEFAGKADTASASSFDSWDALSLGMLNGLLSQLCPHLAHISHQHAACLHSVLCTSQCCKGSLYQPGTSQSSQAWPTD